jgi:VRR-NUC domain
VVAPRDATARLVARLAPPRQRRERVIQHQILRLLRAHGILAWGQNRERAGRTRASHVGFPGLPDIAGVFSGGRALFIEVKRPGAPLTRQQGAALGRLAEQGAATFVAHSPAEVEAWLRAHWTRLL